MGRISVISLFISAVLLSGCNDSAFIEPLVVSPATVHFECGGGTADVYVTHGDWVIERIGINGVDADGTIFDEKGDDSYGPLALNGLGGVIYDGNHISFSVARPDLRHIMLGFGPSADIDPNSVEIHLSNEYEHCVLSVRQDAFSSAK